MFFARAAAVAALVASQLAWVSVAVSQGFGVPLGSEFQVNTYTSGSQTFPDVAIDPAGNFVVVWWDFGDVGTDGEPPNIRGQRYDDTGAAQGGEFRVDTQQGAPPPFSPAVFLGRPAVATDDAGNFVVVWESLVSGVGPGANSFNVQGRRYDSMGAPQGGQFQVNTYFTSHQSRPDVAMDGAGNFVVVWHSFGSAGSDTSYRSIQGQRYDSTGAALGVEFQVNTDTTEDQAYPAVAADGAGNFEVVWQSYGSVGSDASDLSIQGQRYDDMGVAQGTQFQVNTHTTGAQREPAVAADGAGNFVVVWQSHASFPPTSYGIHGQRYDNMGAAQGGQFQVNTYTTGGQGLPAVTADGAGNFVVTWSSDGSAGTDTGSFSVQARRYDSTGAALGGEFQMNTYTTSYQHSSSVAADGAGNFVVVWDSNGSAGSDASKRSVQGQRFALPSATCPAAPDAGCTDVNTPGTRLILREDTPGTESLMLRMGRGPAEMATTLGDPTVSGGTIYALCLYRNDATLVQQYTVDRAGETCGGNPCWRILGPPAGGPPTNGYRYVDPARAEDGIRVLDLRAARRSHLSVRGRNGGGSSNLPLGVTAALDGATSATVQIRGSDATQCLSIALPQVRRSTATLFVAVE